MVHFTSKQLKIVALCLLAIPAAILTAFAVGEVVAGDIGGLQHVAQLVPLIALGWLAWHRPLWGGAALMAGAVLLAGLSFIFIDGFPPGIVTLRVALLFVLPLVAGALFIAAAREEQSAPGAAH